MPDASLGELRLYELMRGGRFNLLDRTDDGRVARATEEGWSDRVGIVRALTAATPDWPAVLLVRPDGYTAWADDVSAPGEQLPVGRAALRHWCGLAIVDRESAAPWYAVISAAAYREPVIRMVPILFREVAQDISSSLLALATPHGAEAVGRY